MARTLATALRSSLLSSVLPIVGTPALIEHAGGYCLASLWRPDEGPWQIETRLSGDYRHRTTVLAFWAYLEAELRMQQPIWPILDQSCHNATPLHPVVFFIRHPHPCPP